MYSTTTLYLTLSALVATSRVTALPSGPAIGGVFAGAPTDGSYPEDAADMEGWAPDGPTYEQPAQDGYVSSPLLCNTREPELMACRIPRSLGPLPSYVPSFTSLLRGTPLTSVIGSWGLRDPDARFGLHPACRPRLVLSGQLLCLFDCTRQSS